MVPDTALAVLTIDLGAIVANWRMLHARHPSGAVVKGDAYGLGARPVAAALYAAGCRDFFVATPGEAFALRDVVPDASLVVLNGLLPGAERDYAAQRLIPALGSLAEIAAWSGPAFLHVDTGMSRLGLDARETERLIAEPARLARVDVRYLMSHFVSSEEQVHPLNAAQRDRFRAIRARLPPFRTSLANSSGIFLGSGFASDLARPGAALYGVNPTPGRANPMRAVVALKARVLAVRDIPAGATVGYNATWTAARDSRIATIGIGYADGWQRGHSNRGAAGFDGHPVPLVGRVSMDLTTYDVTERPVIQPGSWLALLGAHRSVDDAARDAGTIGYEVLTALGRRYHRVYRPA